MKKASQSLRPQTQMKFNMFFPATFSSLLGAKLLRSVAKNSPPDCFLRTDVGKYTYQPANLVLTSFTSLALTRVRKLSFVALFVLFDSKPVSSREGSAVE